MLPIGEITHLTFDCYGVTGRKLPDSNPPRSRPRPRPRISLCFEDEDENENEDEMGNRAFPASHYGTLIDWERGILTTVPPLLARLGVQAAPEAILQSYVRNEARLEGQSWRPYREVLRGVMAGLAVDFRVALSVAEQDSLVNSLPEWPPFPDTVEALRKLSTRFRLVMLSNTDDAFFAETQKRLEVRFHPVITAEQVKGYKPGLAHFHEALRRLAVPATQILHVAQSLYHDHVPARQLGFPTAWVNRPGLLPGTGLAPEASVKPDLVAPDLASLAAQIA